MKRQISASMSDSGYSKDKDLAYIEEELLSLAYICGLDVSGIDELTIDDFITAARSIYSPHANTNGANLASIAWLKTCNFHVSRQIRKFWWQRHIVRGIVN